jgi:hypothetical protein
MLTGDVTLVVKRAWAQAELPPCGTSSLAGRWFGWSESFTTVDHQPFHVATAGRFVPSGCQLHDVSWPAFDECMGKLGRVLLFGDSNSRRAMKVLSSRGDWCSQPGERALGYCACEDCGNVCEERGVPRLFQGSGGRLVVPFGSRNGSVQLINSCGARSLDANVLRGALEEVEWLGGVIIASVGLWDSAVTDLTAFLEQVHSLMRALQQTLPAGTALVFKTWPFFCCGTLSLPNQTYGARRFSHTRGAAMARLYRSVMAAAFPTALWWDSHALSEAAPRAPAAWRDNAAVCHSGHLDSYLVQEDVRVLRHLLCEAARDR